MIERFEWDTIQDNHTWNSLKIATRDTGCSFESIKFLLEKSEIINAAHLWELLKVAVRDKQSGNVSDYILTLAEKHKLEIDPWHKVKLDIIKKR